MAKTKIGWWSCVAAMVAWPGLALGAPAEKNWLPSADEKLPNVMLIGDSISIGYTMAVRELLKGEANVFRPCTPDGKRFINCGDTAKGLEELGEWLGDRKWAVIHFNWGLHDLKYLLADAKGKGALDKTKGKQVRSVEDYAKNLDELVTRLKATGAKLIFATTTVVPEGEPGRVAGDDARYNAAALEVMQKQGVPVNDLHALTKGFAPEMFSKPANVHYSEAGSQKLAERVAAVIRAALK